ncbi:DUF917 family protein [Achromobacter sp. RTa]|uniref:S-methyl thiohydantoin desulfurase domain-containing protein n=1 Tax=Achromobacter sp. RTa TaxID=1532557 RepID=UPI00068C2096|nr:DUF917 family protein [Achromobacter sp. RTa]
MSQDTLGLDDIDAAIAGGLLLSAGGSGRARVAQSRRFAELACARGPLALRSLASLPADGQILVSTAVGAPGAGKHLADPDHALRAARNLVQASGARIDAVMPGHVPGFYAWLLAAELGVPLLDAACNGRGHPTVRMGSLGLSSRPDALLYQCGVGAGLEITLHGNMLTTAALLRAAAVQAGGLIMACRGPLAAGMVSDAAAHGAIGYQLSVGRAMLAAPAQGEARLAALVAATGARVLARGEIAGSTVVYREGFDVGEVAVTDAGTGARIALGVCNEFMTAEADGRRVSTFPDLQAVLDEKTGEVLAISELEAGRRVAVLVVPKGRLPMGAGIFDPAVYPDVEARMNAPLAEYALNPDA